jgi:Protein of unknown function (DUF4238)
MAASATIHHYIPQFYQRGFIADNTGLIWVYEKDKEPRQISVRKTGMEINLYGFTNQEKEFDTQIVESELASIDSDGAKAIHKLEKGLLLNKDERRNICKFVSVMWRRTLKHKKHAEDMAAGMMEKFFEEHNDDWLRQILQERIMSPARVEQLFNQQKAELEKIREQYIQQVPDFIFPNNALRSSIFENVLYAMDWAYFKSTPDTEFLTCDDPVAFNKGSGLKDRNAVIIFPLSRKLLLQAMWITNYRNDFHQLRDTDIRTLNRYTVCNAHNQVYASKKSNVIAGFVNKWIGSFESKGKVD